MKKRMLALSAFAAAMFGVSAQEAQQETSAELIAQTEHTPAQVGTTETKATEVKAADDKSSRKERRRERRKRGLVFGGDGENKPKVQLYGFVRNYFTLDTRESQTVLDGLFYTLPYDQKLNEIGDDLNQQPKAELMAFTTRLGLNLTGPRISENCMLSGKIEMDFCGSGSTNFYLRLRQAFARLAWKHNMLTVGQTWHPMFNADLMPGMMSLETGSPFQPFNRSPQVRYDVMFGKSNGWRFTYDLLWQLQYTSAGPDGADIKYQNYSCIPEMYFGLDYRGKNWTVGVGADLTSIKPYNTTKQIVQINSKDSTISVNCKDRMTSISPMLYLQYKTDSKFKIMAKVVYGQNSSHLNMPSGYGVKSYDAKTGKYEFTPLRMVSAWINPVWTVKSKKTNNLIKWSLFGAYQKNFGSSDGMQDEFVKYAKVQHFKDASKGDTEGQTKTLDQCFRINPSWIYSIKCFDIALEYELTGATFGFEETDKDGKWLGRVDQDKDKNTVYNNRVCLMVKYNF